MSLYYIYIMIYVWGFYLLLVSMGLDYLLGLVELTVL